MSNYIIDGAVAPLSPVGAKLFGADAAGNVGWINSKAVSGQAAARYSDVESVSGRVYTKCHDTNQLSAMGTELFAGPTLNGTYVSGTAPYLSAEGSPVLTQESDARSATKAQGVKWLTNAAGTKQVYAHYSQLLESLTPGMWLRASLWAKRTAGENGDIDAFFYCASGTAGGINTKFTTIDSPTYKRYPFVLRVPGTSLRLGAQASAAYNALAAGVESDKIVMDDISIREVPFASLIDIADHGKSTGKWFAKIELAELAAAGVIFLSDSANPTSYVLCYHDGTNIVFKKSISGEWSDVPSAERLYLYNVATSPAVEYADGKTLSIIREPETNNFSVFYGGVWIGTETITASEIISNTFHGSFSTHDDSQVVFSYAPAETVMDVVYLGGSITNGSGADGEGYSWRRMLMSTLDNRYKAVSFVHHNAAAGGTDSFNTLMRLSDEVLPLKPAVVFLDQSANDNQLPPTAEGFPYIGEATVRRLREAYPFAKLVICDFLRPIGTDGTPSVNTEALRTAWAALASHYGCEFYAMANDVLAALGGPSTEAQIDAYFYAAGDVHPNRIGHAMIHAALSEIDVLAHDDFTDVSDYDWLCSTEKYGRIPKTILGKSLLDSTDSSGTWSVSGTAVASSTAGSILAYTGIFSAIGLDLVLQSGAWPAGLQYSIDGGEYASISPTNPSVGRSEFLFLTGVGKHTIKIKLNSGSATINSLLAL